MKADAQVQIAELDLRRQRRLEAIRLQEIEGNPLTAEEIEMFEMFDREGWSQEKRLEFILNSSKDFCQ